MSDKILIVTPPDDTLINGVRILHVELNEEQSMIVSSALINSNTQHTTINYVWKMGDSIEWLLDKVPKSNFILFNADRPNNGATELIIGYIAAQPNSYYFGNLRDLNLVNKSVIYNSDQIINILENHTNKNAR
jgi:lipopolysaccharide export LptBFGC system permease protein LptF